MASRNFKLRNYYPGDQHAICALFEKVFGKPMGDTESIRHWQWEYTENPVKDIFIKLAWDNEQLVGQYAASPVRMHFEGQDLIVALSHDTMTDPQYGGLGIFKNTAEALYKDQETAGHFFIYGFPNHNSIHGFKKYLNWHQIMPLPVHIRPIGIMTQFLKRMLANGHHSSFNDHETILSQDSVLLLCKSSTYDLLIESKFGDWADNLWQRCRSQHRVWVIRDKTYLNWRYVSRPESKYDIISIWQGDTAVGYVITSCVEKNFGKTLFVLDFMVDQDFPEAAGILIKYIIIVAKKSNAVFASVLLTPGSCYRRLFRRYLFLPLPEIMFPKPMYIGVRCFQPAINRTVIDPNAWSFSWGDNDVL